MSNRMSKKQQFFIVVIMCFITIFIYEMLTPMFSDDLSYQTIVNEAQGIGDLFRQEYRHYSGWTGRNVVHMVMRVLMYINNNVFTRVFLSCSFTVMTFLMYKLSKGSYLLCILLVWIFGAQFAETVLWMTGACNYLVGTTIILTDMAFYEWILGKRDKGTGKATLVLVAIVLGILAGWCNENTSGGLILFGIYLIWRTKYLEKGKVPIAVMAGFVANIVGFAFMILAPGNYVRAASREDTGSLVGRLAARFLSVTNSIYNLFFPLLAVAIIIGVLLYYRGVTFQKAQRFYLFLFLFAATSYSLILAPDAQERAFFGAGIFLFISLATGIEILCNKDLPLEGQVALFPLHWLKPAITYTLLLYMFFTYIDSGAKLAWIYREEMERMEYLAQQQAAGVNESDAPLLRPQFETKYSAAYKMDIHEDWRYWINTQYAAYYNLDLISGVSREEWTEY